MCLEEDSCPRDHLIFAHVIFIHDRSPDDPSSKVRMLHPQLVHVILHGTTRSRGSPEDKNAIETLELARDLVVERFNFVLAMTGMLMRVVKPAV